MIAIFFFYYFSSIVRIMSIICSYMKYVCSLKQINDDVSLLYAHTAAPVIINNISVIIDLVVYIKNEP